MIDPDTTDIASIRADGGSKNGEKIRVFSEVSPFVQMLENPGRVKIIDTLIRRPESMLTAEQISNQGNLSESTFSRNKDFLLELGVMSSFDENGKTLYRINKEHDVVKLLAEFHTELLNHAEEILETSQDSRVKIVNEALELIRDSETDDGESGEDDIDDVSRMLMGEMNG